jgi:hypothetical protein
MPLPTRADFPIEVHGMTTGTFGTQGQLLSTLADITHEMGAAAQICRSYQSVHSATPGCFIHKLGYMNNDTVENEHIVSFEAWIEIVTREQRSLTCYLELRAHKDRWIIERNIVENLVENQNVISEFEDIISNTFESYARDIGDLTRQLTAKVAIIDFSAAQSSSLEK